MIKYLGSKRRLAPVLADLAEASGAVTALDLFTGTTRVAQAFKSLGLDVTAVDTTHFAHTFARCYIETDSSDVDRAALSDRLAELQSVTPVVGYLTRTFAEQARFLHPDNAARIDAMRQLLAARVDDPLFPILLTSVIEAADRVDSTTGVQMAFLKDWAPRALKPIELRTPELLSGRGRAVLGDASELVTSLGPFDLAYLDPPYNQHRYDSNYHVWETLAVGDEPEHFGKACKRADLRDPALRSPFSVRRLMPDALARCIERVDAATVMVSLSDESWVSIDDLRDMCAVRGAVEMLGFTSRRYVGAQIGIHSPSGQRVGTVGRLHNTEHVAICGEIRPALRRRLDALSAEGVTPPAR